MLELFTGSLLRMGWIKTCPAWKLLVQVKFTGNMYSYVCEWPLKYMQTCVCRNSYTGTRTVPDSYSCLCEYSLMACRCQWSIGDRPLTSKQLCPLLPFPSSFSCIWNLLLMYLFRTIFSRSFMVASLVLLHDKCIALLSYKHNNLQRYYTYILGQL